MDCPAVHTVDQTETDIGYLYTDVCHTHNSAILPEPQPDQICLDQNPSHKISPADHKYCHNTENSIHHLTTESDPSLPYGLLMYASF